MMGVVVLLVFVFRYVRSDGANHNSCDRSQHAMANLVADESAARASDQRRAQRTVALLARDLGLSGSHSATVVAIGRLLTIGRLLAIGTLRARGGLLTVCRLLAVLLLLVGCRAAVGWLLRIVVWGTIRLLRGGVVARLRRGTTVVLLLWVSGLIPLRTVIGLRGVILLLAAAVGGLLLPAAVVISAGHGALVRRRTDGGWRLEVGEGRGQRTNAEEGWRSKRRWGGITL